MNARDKFTDRLMPILMDCLILLLVLALLVTFLLFLRPRAGLLPDTDLLYTVRFPLVRAEYTEDIHTGNAVMDAVGKRQIGEVVSFSVSPAVTETYDRTTGKIRPELYPGYVTLVLRIRAKARHTEEGFSLSGLTLHRGTSLPLRLPNFVGTGTCTDTQILTEP